MTTVHVGFRLEPETVARLDALLPALSTPWHVAKRSDAIRAAILAGLPIVERFEPPEVEQEAGCPMTRDELLRLAITDMFKLMGDVDGVVADMLRPARQRELGPIMHASLYGDAHEGILDNLRHMARLVDGDGGDGGVPGDDAPPWEPGADPTHPAH